MRVLRLGVQGDDVEAWKLFLRGQGYYTMEASRLFDDEAFQVTQTWQLNQGLGGDGEVGRLTYAKAMQAGFDPGVEDDSDAEDGPNWPAKPEFSSLSYMERIKLFGQFEYEAAPVTGNPEAIKIHGDWVKKNISVIDIPVLDALDKHLGDDRFSFNTRCADQIIAFFKAVDDAGLADRILTWGGSWNPRFIRGSRTSLSNHTFGTAFDINVQWNWMKTVPALKGKKGSVRELVEIGHAHGLFWGGHFTRLDGMHFEVCKLL